jgi:hypothetical protein
MAPIGIAEWRETQKAADLLSGAGRNKRAAKKQPRYTAVPWSCITGVIILESVVAFKLLNLCYE